MFKKKTKVEKELVEKEPEKKVLGDLISVTLKEGVGRTEESILVRFGSCVEDVLRQGGATPKEGAEIRLNGEPTKMSQVVEDGDIVTIMRKISGADL